MSKNATSHLDAAGWLFWLIVSLVLLGPAIWFAWRVADPYVSRLYPIGIGAVAALVLASFISTGVNYTLQYRQKKQKKAVRKRAKKSIK